MPTCVLDQKRNDAVRVLVFAGDYLLRYAASVRFRAGANPLKEVLTYLGTYLPR